MRLRSILPAVALLGMLAAPGMAAAATAYAVGGTTNMRAGPGTNYPVIAQVIGGSRVEVIGCLSDYSWCDGTVQGFRGWMAASRLEFPYAERRVLVPQYYAYFGAPVIGFDVGFWGGDRHRWRDGHRWRDRDRGRNRDRDRGDWRPDRGRDRGGWRGPGADSPVYADEPVGRGGGGGCASEWNPDC